MREFETELELQSRQLSQRVDMEQRKLHSKFQAELEAKLSELRNTYESKMSILASKDLQQREAVENRLRDAEKVVNERWSSILESKELVWSTEAARDR